ncbi:MAG: GGDEF domain-containing protein [Syntrophales bacterium]
MISQEELGRIRLFQAVDLDSITGLIDACTERTLSAGEELITAGQVNRTVYFILSGSVAVHLDSAAGAATAVLGPGESVAEMSVIDCRPASASVVAVESTRLLAMDEDILWSLVRSSHAAACNLLLALTARLRRANAVLAGNGEAEGEGEEYGTVDALTGLHNRPWLEKILTRQIERISCGGQPPRLAVIMVDIDDFKAFNKRYGSVYGDHVLSFVSHTICDRLRPTEVISRYGGDEFVIFIPGIDMDLARQIGDRIHRGIMDAVPAMPDGRTIPHPTISLGITMLQPGQTAEDLLDQASLALTRARSDGGNRIAE